MEFSLELNQVVYVLCLDSEFLRARTVNACGISVNMAWFEVSGSFNI